MAAVAGPGKHGGGVPNGHKGPPFDVTSYLATKQVRGARASPASLRRAPCRCSLPVAQVRGTGASGTFTANGGHRARSSGQEATPFSPAERFEMHRQQQVHAASDECALIRRTKCALHIFGASAIMCLVNSSTRPYVAILVPSQ
jgi:hypothetical protein